MAVDVHFLIYAGDVAETMQDLRTEIVVAAKYDGHARKKKAAVANGELEGGVVRNHHQIETVSASRYLHGPGCKVLLRFWDSSGDSAQVQNRIACLFGNCQNF